MIRQNLKCPRQKGRAMATKCAQRMGLLMLLQMKQLKTLTKKSAALTHLHTQRLEKEGNPL